MLAVRGCYDSDVSIDSSSRAVESCSQSQRIFLHPLQSLTLKMVVGLSSDVLILFFEKFWIVVFPRRIGPVGEGTI
jgi:hypothetical protein